MGYIQINSITLSPTPPGIILVNVAYKLASNPDVPASYTLYGQVSVNPNGAFVGGALFINNLTEGVQYTIHIYAECFGTKVNYIPIPGANGTSTTTTLPLVTVNWSFTKNGKNTNDYYYVVVRNSTGSVVYLELLNNVDGSGTFYPPAGSFLVNAVGMGGTLDDANYNHIYLRNETDSVTIQNYEHFTEFNLFPVEMLAGRTYTLLLETDVVGVPPPATTTTSTTTTLFCPQINNIFINASSS